MILLRDAGIVILEIPKTATQALRAMLQGLAEVDFAGAARHVPVGRYLADHAAAAAAACGRMPETVAVVRDPLDRMASWHRYLARDRMAGHVRSSASRGFAEFVSAALDRTLPQFQSVGRQDRFVGWDGRRAAVDHLFAHDRLDALVAFLADRTGRPLRLPARNVSPARAPEPLPPALLARLQAKRAAEFDLHRAVARRGHLRRGAMPTELWGPATPPEPTSCRGRETRTLGLAADVAAAVSPR